MEWNTGTIYVYLEVFAHIPVYPANPASAYALSPLYPISVHACSYPSPIIVAQTYMPPRSWAHRQVRANRAKPLLGFLTELALTTVTKTTAYSLHTFWVMTLPKCPKLLGHQSVLFNTCTADTSRQRLNRYYWLIQQLWKYAWKLVIPFTNL